MPRSSARTSMEASSRIRWAEGERERERERNIQTGSERGRCRCLSDTTPRDAGSAEAHCRAHQHALARRQAAESGGQKERERETYRQTYRQAESGGRMPRLPCTKKLPCAPGRACGGQGGSPIPVTCRTEQTEGQSSRCRAHGHVSRGEWQGLEGEWLWRAAKSHYLSGGASRARRSCPRLTATLHVDQSVQVQHSVLASSRRE